jgi:ABC-type lipoprotein export system ATPase subunit
MRITKISVEKLFGIFDHEIPLNLDDRITIIHGPNGYGKTIILKMLYGLFSCEYSELLSVPYKSLQVEFDDNSRLEVNSKQELPDSYELFIQYFRDGYEPQHISFKQGFVSFTSNDSAAEGEWAEGKPPKHWFDIMADQFNVYLIESQRLLRFSNAKQLDKQFQLITDQQSPTFGPALSTVKTYADEMVKRIDSVDREYAVVSQALDRSFPLRGISPSNPIELTDDALQQKLKALERHRHRLVSTGLLTQAQEPEFQMPQHPLDKSTKNFLAVYVEDTEKKLNVFGDLPGKIELFKRVMNSKLSYKEMQIDREQGFVFTIKYPNGHNAGSDTVSPMDLSSGEQHELVLLYELLFKVQPKSLVLIDEPELSLHIGWQVNFLRDLQEITKLADIDILIATHAPDLIADRWDLTVELKGVS